MKYITKTVWILGLVSLFTDAASEMLYPVMPIYLKSIGFSIVLIGVLEGLAEAVAGLSKGFFGQLSDSKAKRVPFVQIGYALSAVSKPMMAMFVFPIWIFLARTLDRFGKGIRTGARDALLSNEATADLKGKIFGFHRSMDTLGAVIGPLMALLFLHFYPENYRVLFFLAFIPGLFATLFSIFLREKKNSVPLAKSKKAITFFSFLNYWKQAPKKYRRVVIGILIFTLFNSSDVFLLLKVKQLEYSDTQVIGIYIFYNLIYALSAFPAGIIADKIGLKKMYLIGLLIFSIVYLGMGFCTSISNILILFFLYGVYAAATEGISKAWITNIVAKKNTATAIGTLAAFQSIFTMVASSIAGLVWYYYGAVTIFIISAIATLMVVFYFIVFTKKMS